MTKKNRKTKDEQDPENEPAEDQVESTGSAGGEDEASESPEAGAETSVDELLEDVRRSLIEEDTEAQATSSGWLGKLTKGRRKGQKPAEPAPVQPVAEPPAASKPEPEAEYLEQIDQLIDMLEDEQVEPVSEPKLEVPIAAPEEPEPVRVEVPEEPVDVGELKKRVFSSSKEAPPEEDFSQVRAVALEGGEEVFVEVEAKKEDLRQDRIKALENSLRPYRGYFFFLIAILGVVLAVLAGTVMFRAYQSMRPPAPTPTLDNLPYPTQVILPGGLNFSLGRGQIVDGSWNPQGPEWLTGTQICRWVAIPWSRPLEAAVRTLTRSDAIELVMSNNDQLTYDVVAIEQLTLEQMQELDQNSPCLLVVLAEQDAEARWVVTAKP